MVKKKYRSLILLSFCIFLLSGICWAEEESPKISETTPTVATDVTDTASVDTNTLEASSATITFQPAPLQPREITKTNTFFDPMNYTLGADDVIQIEVRRHPEFSGIFPVNMEGKIQLNYAGDIEVTGLTKNETEEKIKSALSNYIINPTVTVTIMDYRSKVIYVLGEVGAPGKYYMRAETIPVREALVQAGLPTLSAAMRRCRIITPDKGGKAKIKQVDVYSLLYGGDLTKNIDMHAGDVLYVPATVMAKIINVINPVTTAVGVSASGPSSASTAKTAVTGTGLSGRTGTSF